jgi:hypothetical protein
LPESNGTIFAAISKPAHSSRYLIFFQIDRIRRHSSAPHAARHHCATYVVGFSGDAAGLLPSSLLKRASNSAMRNS